MKFDWQGHAEQPGDKALDPGAQAELEGLQRFIAATGEAVGLEPVPVESILAKVAKRQKSRRMWWTVAPAAAAATVATFVVLARQAPANAWWWTQDTRDRTKLTNELAKRSKLEMKPLGLQGYDIMMAGAATGAVKFKLKSGAQRNELCARDEPFGKFLGSCKKIDGREYKVRTFDGKTVVRFDCKDVYWEVQGSSEVGSISLARAVVRDTSNWPAQR